MKLFLVAIICSPYISLSQNANKKADTIIYDHHKYFVGKDVQLDYGSNDNKSFNYVFWGPYDEPSNPVDAKWASTILQVEKIYSINNRVYLKCHTNLARNNFHIDLKDAIEHHEIKL